MRFSVSAAHLISQWMYITGASTPAEWNELLQHYSVSNDHKRPPVSDLLEISQLFWFEDIFVSQKIYAIVYDCLFKIEIKPCLIWPLRIPNIQ